MNKRRRGRSRNTNHKQNNNPNRSLDSNGPDVRVRGSAKTVYDKYIQLARDAVSSGHRVKAENLLQHAEHYLRIYEVVQAKADAEKAKKQAEHEARQKKHNERREAQQAQKKEQQDKGTNIQNSAPDKTPDQANGKDKSAPQAQKSGDVKTPPVKRKPRAKKTEVAAQDQETSTA